MLVETQDLFAGKTVFKECYGFLGNCQPGFLWILYLVHFLFIFYLCVLKPILD